MKLENDVSIQELESRAYTWVQLGQLKQGNYIDSLVTLEAVNSRCDADIVDGTLMFDNHLVAIKRVLVSILTMMNRPLFIFQAICLQGFPHHLLVYLILPTEYGTFNMRVRAFSLGVKGICDIRQWILMCRFNIGRYY